MYDLTVIGGGPAGATCARRAAELGLDVVLLEKAYHPREKPCGGALGPQTIRNLDLDITRVIERTFHAALVHIPSMKKVMLTSEDLTGYLVTRSKFDSFLLQMAADAGVEVLQGVEVVGLEQTRSGVRALAVGDSYKSHLLVGADGVNGIIAKELDIRSKWAPDKIALCISADVPMRVEEVESIMTTCESDGSPVIELFFDLLPWGYGWCFPKKHGFNIGIGCRMDRQENLQQNWEKLVRKLEKEKGLEFDMSNRVSYRVPLGDKLNQCTARRSMLIGDAAGLVSPLTGEGISYAIQSGKLAAKVASEAVNMKSPNHIAEYEDYLKKTIGQELIDTRWIAEILHKSDKHKELLFQIVAEDPVMRRYITNIVSRVATFSDMRVQIGKRMLSKHPLKSIRLGFKGS
ncbi:MAG: NAD(P)/FAD-dependent oxidoreductase [Candidatus Sifarchaeia archaeon]